MEFVKNCRHPGSGMSGAVGPDQQCVDRVWSPGKIVKLAEIETPVKVKRLKALTWPSKVSSSRIGMETPVVIQRLEV